jgi:hypothetical protein
VLYQVEDAHEMVHGCSVDIKVRGAGGSHVGSVVFIQISEKCVVTVVKYGMAGGWVERSIPLLPGNSETQLKHLVSKIH